MQRVKTFKPNLGGANKRFNSRAHIEAMYKTADWINYSKKFLEVNQKCYCCGNASQVTDHIVPHKGKKELFEKLDNHLPLCTKCHNTATALFDRFTTPKTNEKLAWLQRMRLKLGITVRVMVMPRYT